MVPEIRKKTILKTLEKREEASISELAEKCAVAEITIRRDLSELQERGLLTRTHGGAILNPNSDTLFGFDKKKLFNENNKLAICKLAATFVKEGDIIYMDCGTTVFLMARFLSKFSNLRVITNSLPVVSELMPFTNIKVNLIGGELDSSRKALYGPTTENLLSKYKADKAFIGAGGVSIANGISSNDEKEASITLKMAKAAQEVFLLCDSSKIEVNSYFIYSSLSLIDYLITDNDIAPEKMGLYKKNKINLLTT